MHQFKTGSLRADIIHRFIFLGIGVFLLSVFYFLFSLKAFAEDSVAAADTSSSTPPLSSRATELQQNISSHQDEIKKLEAEIADYQIRLVNVGNQKKTLQGAVQTIDLTRAKLSADTKLTQAKIAQTNDTISSFTQNINQKQDRIVKDRQLIADIIHKIDQTDSDSLTEVILGNASISAFLIDIDDLGRLQMSIRESISSLERLKSELSVQKNSFQVEQKKLLGLKSQLADQKQLADQQRLEQSRLLSETKNQESNYKKQLADKQARKKQFEKEIDDFEAQLRAEIDPNSFPKAGTKVLAYPLDDPLVTQKFGKTSDSGRLYSSGTHNGIDFRAAPGTPIKAAGDGIVVGSGDTDRVCRGASYGRWIMIQHKNGLSSIYGHLELVKVGQGQQVNVGDVIGYSGATGYATGPHLHFGLFVTSAVQIVDLPSKTCPRAVFHIPASAANGYLDPQAYL